MFFRIIVCGLREYENLGSVWNNGIMEYWNIGILMTHYSDTPSIHYSNIPLLQTILKTKNLDFINKLSQIEQLLLHLVFSFLILMIIILMQFILVRNRIAKFTVLFYTALLLLNSFCFAKLLRISIKTLYYENVTT